MPRTSRAGGPGPGGDAAARPAETALIAAAVDDGLSPLGSAVRRGNIAVILEQLGGGADPNEADLLGETPLFEAAACGRKDVVAALLASRADVRRRSLAGGLASDVCADRSTRLLLTLFRGARLDAAAEALALDGVSPYLRRALWPELRRCRAEAMERGEAGEEEEEALAERAGASEAPLALAVQAGNLQLSLQLLQDGADPNETDAVGETPLFEAAAAGNAGVVAALLLANADPQRQSPSGNSAADFAADAPTRELLGLFRGEGLEALEPGAACLAGLSEGLRGAVLRALGRRRRTHGRAAAAAGAPAPEAAPASEAAPAPAPAPALSAAPKAEAAAGPSPAAPAPGDGDADEACTPLALAARAEDFALVAQLLGQRADPNEGDAVGETPLFEAALTGNVNVAAVLLLNGADPARRSLSDMVAEDLAGSPAAKALLVAARGGRPEPAAAGALLAELRPELGEALRHRSVIVGVSNRLRQGSARQRDD